MNLSSRGWVYILCNGYKPPLTRPDSSLRHILEAHDKHDINGCHNSVWINRLEVIYSLTQLIATPRRLVATPPMPMKTATTHLTSQALLSEMRFL